MTGGFLIQRRGYLRTGAGVGVAGLMILAFVLTGFMISPPSAAATSGASPGYPPWTMTTPYPNQIYLESCVTAQGYIFCVGGVASSASGSASGPTNLSTYAKASASGIGTWQSTSNYPLATSGGSSEVIAGTSCAASSGFIYCVGGQTSSSSPLNSTYFAPLSSSGIGTWTAGIPYPTGVSGASCTVSSGYIYCVGGQTTSTEGTDVYSAPVTSAGIGTWSSGPLYPASSNSTGDLGATFVSCAASSSDLYCLGSYAASSSPPSAVFFAPLSSGAVGQWQETTPYPAPVTGASCTAPDGFLVCAGGFTYSSQFGALNATYFAPITTTGVGTWEQSGLVPSVLPSCTTDSSYVYCVGGLEVTPSSSAETAIAYYASLAALTTAGTFSTSSTTYTTSTSSSQGPCLEGFDFSPGGAFGDYLYAGSLCTGQIYRVAPNGTTTLWASNLTSVADIQFVRSPSGMVKMYLDNANDGYLQVIVPCASACSYPGLPPGYKIMTNASNLNYPKGVTSPPAGCNCPQWGNGSLYVAQSGSGEIMNYTGGALQPFANVGSQNFPVGMAFGNGSFGDYMYVGLAYDAVSNGSGYGLVRVAPNGTVENFALQGMGIAPVAMDPAGYSPGLYAGEYATGQIWKVNPDGTSSLFMSLPSTQVRYMKFAPASFGGELYYTDYGTGNIYVVSPNGTPTIFAQTAGVTTTSSGSQSTTTSSTSSSIGTTTTTTTTTYSTSVASTTSTPTTSGSPTSSISSTTSVGSTTTTSSPTASTSVLPTTSSAGGSASTTTSTQGGSGSPTLQATSASSSSSSGAATSSSTTGCSNCILYTPLSLVAVGATLVAVVLAVTFAALVRKGRGPFHGARRPAERTL